MVSAGVAEGSRMRAWARSTRLVELDQKVAAPSSGVTGERRR
jgi:hypothetical protein